MYHVHDNILTIIIQRKMRLPEMIIFKIIIRAVKAF